MVIVDNLVGNRRELDHGERILIGDEQRRKNQKYEDDK